VFGVGGDWYDVIQLPEGRAGLIVGDVMGHGVMAAAIMGQLRVAVRAYAQEWHPPGLVLARVEPLRQELAGGSITTIIYAILDPDGYLHFADAGHPPPLLVSTQGNRFTLDGPSPPLGAATTATTRVEHTTRIPRGSTLFLYTDGLLERRNRPIDDGLALLQSILRNPVDSLDHLCDRAIQALIGTENEDDVCALAARLASPQ
jgi:serine phosphatase RsbU (regulator of sigma subunit)